MDLVEAVKIGDTNRIKELLEAGTDVDHVGDNGYTALIYSSIYSNEPSSLEIIRLLLEAGANPNHVANNGWTVLMFFAEYITMFFDEYITRSSEILKLLLEAGAEPNYVANNDNTALRLLVGPSHNTISLATVRLLLEAGANPIRALDICLNNDCKKLISRFIWKHIYDNIDLLSSKYSKSGEMQLPKEIWKLILLRRKLDQLCKELSNERNKYILMGFTEMFEIPIHEDITKRELYNLISNQLVWGSRYSQESVDYFKTEEAKANMVKAAILLGIDPNQPINKIAEEMVKRF